MLLQCFVRTSEPTSVCRDAAAGGVERWPFKATNLDQVTDHHITGSRTAILIQFPAMLQDID